MKNKAPYKTAIVASIGIIVVGTVAYLLNNANVLWALLLVYLIVVDMD